MEELVTVVPILLITMGLPWLFVYLHSRRLAAVEVELRELSTLIKSTRMGAEGADA